MKKWSIFILIMIILTVSIIGLPDIMMRMNLFSKGAVLMDGKTGDILYSKNQNKTFYPASITKVLTALIVVENADLDDIVVVGDEIDILPADSSLSGIEKGEEYSVYDLLMGLMLVSGNDAANSLAVYTARQMEDETLSADDALDAFAKYMNTRAKELGARNSHFINPHGYHSDGHYTTAYDMALIAREAISHDEIIKIASTDRYQVKGLNWTNTNYMVVQGSTGYYEYATGLKTGHTSIAKYCLITTAKKNDKELISVILKSSSRGRWKDARALMDYGFGDKKINIEKIKILGEYMREKL
ncbi:MAG: D-alanyl-D-alanine carboxypeptidase [Clostridiales bacterium]|nr:D-alanyl-D-alanine carboxypeptidase [Clostridiales bacterium]